MLGGKQFPVPSRDWVCICACCWPGSVSDPGWSNYLGGLISTSSNSTLVTQLQSGLLWLLDICCWDNNASLFLSASHLCNAAMHFHSFHACTLRCQSSVYWCQSKHNSFWQLCLSTDFAHIYWSTVEQKVSCWFCLDACLADCSLSDLAGYQGTVGSGDTRKLLQHTQRSLDSWASSYIPTPCQACV